MVQNLRAAVFILQMYVMMALMALVFTPMVPFRRSMAFTACQTWCRWVRWTARWMIGLRSEVRGEVPQGECLIAAKHQSFFDVILIVSVVPRPKFIMKAELKWLPIVGWYAHWTGCVPIQRKRRARAILDMKARVEAGRSVPGQLIIYPQGTRAAPGAVLPYKIGTGVLYEQLEQDCVPAATNVGLFWPRAALWRKPGLAVVEFLEPIQPGLPRDRFMQILEERIESVTDSLMAEAGGPPGGTDHHHVRNSDT